MKSVAIVGAGPAGLVAAKTLLRNGQGKFEVTIFEKQDSVGGMWALQPTELHGGKCNPQMPTNLSRFSVSFGDLAWQSVNLQRQGSKTEPLLPVYPKAWQVGQYLQEYARRYLPNEAIKLNCQVEYAGKIERDGKAKWQIKWSNEQQTNGNRSHVDNADASRNEAVFDHLIVSSGFFGAPRDPSFDVQTGGRPKVLHSSKFRAMEDLVPQPQPKEGTVVVVGGGMSGSEAAVAVAMAQSNALHAPSTKGPMPTYNIVHVTSRPFYDIPRMNPQNSAELPDGQVDHAPRFLPNDLSMFNLSKIPPGRIVPSNGLAPPDKAEKGHPWMHSIIGGDQSDIGSEALHFSETQTKRPGFIGITDNYTEFARSGIITTALGRVTEVGSASESGLGIVQYRNEDGQINTIPDVAGVVYATGFSPHSSLRWLEKSILDDLDYDEECFRLPLILYHHTSYNPSHPDIGFIGMYEGPFWAVMEMQAREITKRWITSEDEAPSKLDYEEPDMVELRAAMRQNRTDVPQFWMRDYLQMVECLAQRHGIERADEGFGPRSGPIAAARYTAKEDDKDQATTTISDLQDILKDHIDWNRFVGSAVFRGLQGRWKITRKLESFLPGFPSGTLQGHAYFHPRFPTDASYEAEYLYVEDGTLTTDVGLTLKANKRYVYRYSEPKDQLSVWFVKDDGKTVDYFFHDILLRQRSNDSCKEGWRAVGNHWCDPDQYDCHYRLKFNGAALQAITIQFIVKGPNKDYVSETQFERTKIE